MAALIKVLLCQIWWKNEQLFVEGSEKWKYFTVMLSACCSPLFACTDRSSVEQFYRFPLCITLFSTESRINSLNHNINFSPSVIYKKPDCFRLILSKKHLIEAAVRWCSSKQVILKIRQYTKENTFVEVSF